MSQSSTILIVGPRQVGKTAIINHITNGSFNNEYYPNIGLDFYVKLARISDSYRLMKIFEVQPIQWEGYPCGLIQYYSQLAELILIVCDASNFQQIHDIEDIFRSIVEQKKCVFEDHYELKQPSIAIVCNINGRKKCKQVTTWISSFAQKHNLPLYEINSENRKSTMRFYQLITHQIDHLTPLQHLFYPFKLLYQATTSLIASLYLDWMELLRE